VSAPVLCTVGVVIMFYIESHCIHPNTWKTTVCYLFSCCGINAFRMASSNSSLAAKSCACAYIVFLAGIFSWYAVSSAVDCGGLDCNVTKFEPSFRVHHNMEAISSSETLVSPQWNYMSSQTRTPQSTLSQTWVPQSSHRVVYAG
jgi:hypothetical protein